jgi:Helix-turn-helix domain
MTKDFTPQDVAALSGRAVSTILQWIRSKKLKAHKARGYVVSAEDLRDFLLKEGAKEKLKA